MARDRESGLPSFRIIDTRQETPALTALFATEPRARLRAVTSVTAGNKRREEQGALSRVPERPRTRVFARAQKVVSGDPPDAPARTFSVSVIKPRHEASRREELGQATFTKDVEAAWGASGAGPDLRQDRTPRVGWPPERLPRRMLNTSETVLCSVLTLKKRKRTTKEAREGEDDLKVTPVPDLTGMFFRRLWHHSACSDR